jgi:hypothetical protein
MLRYCLMQHAARPAVTSEAAGVRPQAFAFPFGPPSPNTYFPTGARSVN